MMMLELIPTLLASRERKGGNNQNNSMGRCRIAPERQPEIQKLWNQILCRGQRAAGEAEGEGAAEGDGGEAPAQGMDTD